MKKSKSSKKTSEKPAANELPGDDFLIVGIGASAGGVQSLKAFFENVPPDSGAAFVVILHLSPAHESHLAEILQTSAQISVKQVTERVKVEPNHVFVVPPNQSLAMADGHLVVSPIHTIEERRAPVDIFFRTLAETHHERAVCVVLSGTGADGSMGLKRVKENGGAVFVQNPREAEYNDMVRNAIATNLVDEVLNVADIPAKIVEYRENLKAVALPVQPEARPEEEQKALREVFTQLRVRTGHDFTNYKRPTILRRIERRISVRNLSGIAEYARYLKKQPEEVQALLKDLLISVTNFFRDKQAFAVLENDVVPRILENKRAGDQIRVWVAGCATGEEAYSIAMLLAEKTQGGIDSPEIQIFASDIDETAIATAREGFYTINDAADVSPEQLRRFFTKEPDGYRIRRELREQVLFANHNVLKDPPFSRLDLATCRNMLIYFNQAAQKRVMETFHFALKPNGFLFLGASESIDGSIDLFAPLNKENNVFQSRNVEAKIPRPAANLTMPATRFEQVQTQAQTSLKANREQETRALERLSFADLHQRLLEQYAPPSVIVNEDYDILHLSESAGRFMQMGGGEPSNNLLKIIRSELRLELRTALYQAVQKRHNVEARNLTLKIGDRNETINIHVRPVLRHEDTARGFILVLFEKTEDAPDDSETALTLREPIAQQLEEELMRVKAQLRSANEQHEIQAEELKASNEELQAMNEELRSSGEELETGKEELQSINEELVTVNQELKIKIEELSQSNSDFQNLMASSDIGTIFLDRSLRVKMFTPVTRSIINLLPSDLGRPLTDLTTYFVYEKLQEDCERVLEKLQPLEREIPTSDRRWFLLRILPYRTAEDQISGVVMTFLDITERVRREAELKDLNAKIEQQVRIFDTTLSSIVDFAYIFDRDGRFIYSNYALLDLLGLTWQEIKGKNFFDLNYPPDLAARLQKQIQEVFDTGKIVRDETAFTSSSGAGGFYEYIFTPVFGADGTSVESVAGSTRDVTERKRTENELRENRARLERAMNAGRIFSWEMNPTTRELEWSSNTENVIGFALLDNIDKTFELIHPDDVNQTVDAINQAIETGGDYESEYRLVNPANNATFYFHSQGAMTTRTPDGQPLFAGITQNITERKRSEEAIIKAEKRLRIAVEAAAMGTWTWNLATDEVIWNNQHFALFGMEPKNPVSAKDFFDHVHPDDREMVRARLEKTIKEKVLFEAEFRAVLDDGTTRWMNGYGQVVEEENNRSALLGGVMLDITTRKQTEESLRESEERSRLLIEGATDFAIIKISPQNLIESWNSGAEKLFGYRESEIVGQSGAILFTPEDREKGEPLKEIEIAFQNERSEDERWHLRKDGSRFFASGVLMQLQDSAKGFVKIARDLTQKIEAEKALRAKEILQKLVGAQEDERKRIARDLHDELGQKLTALRLKLESIRKMCDDEPLCSQIDETQVIAKHIDDDVDFLAWELRPAALDDLGLFTALDNYVREWSRHAGTTAETHFTGVKGERLMPEIETNLYRIAQEALNNTHKHASAKTVNLIVEGHAASVVLIIEDDGVGFEPENTFNRSKGLGLIGMRERAVIIGGTLEIESAPGQGTTIFVRVPAIFVK